jgi:hypothetical protein
MSPLDTAAVEFFGALKSIYGDLGNYKTLSRKHQCWLLSGEELELWLLKTAFGLFHSGNVSKDRKKLCDVQNINAGMMEAFSRSPGPGPLWKVYYEEAKYILKSKYFSILLLCRMTTMRGWSVFASGSCA